MREKLVYLDAASNTPVDSNVARAMKPYLKKNFVGNSHSAHDFGIKASMAIEDARNNISLFLGVDCEDVIFTSGATESNNTVIKALAYKEMSSGKPKKDQKRHIVCGSTEHDSIINPCKQLEKIGFKVTYLKPNKEGRITYDSVVAAIKTDTLLLCLMSVNNELGSMNEVAESVQYTRMLGVPSLVDCTQSLSYGGNSLNLGYLYPGASFLTFSAHKIYGPTGIGCLIARNDGVHKYLSGGALLAGGAQEYGIRGGTSNTAAIVGMKVAIQNMGLNNYKQHFEDLSNYLIEGLNRVTGGKYEINGCPDHKNIVNVNLSKYVTSDRSLAVDFARHGIALSAGSACDSEHNETKGSFNPSHVLLSIGLDEVSIRNSVRLSFSKYTTKKDIDLFLKVLEDVKTDYFSFNKEE